MREVRFIPIAEGDWRQFLVVPVMFLLIFGSAPFLVPRPWSPGGVAFIVFFATGFVLISGVATYRLRRLAGLGAVVTDEGVGRVERGDIVWMLLWDRYGYAKPLARKYSESVWRPEDGGVQVYDREGELFGVLPIAQLPVRQTPNYRGIPYERICSQMTLYRLHEKTAPGFQRIVSLHPTVEPMSRLASGVVFAMGALAGVLSVWISRLWFEVTAATSPPSGWTSMFSSNYSILLVLGAYALCVCLLVAGLMGLLYRKVNVRLATRELKPPSRIHEFLLENGPKLKPIELESGKVYHLSCQAFHEEAIKGSIVGAKGVAILVLVLAAMFILIGFYDPTATASLMISLCAVFTAIALGAGYAQGIYTGMLSCIQDTFIVKDQTLAVTKADGRQLTFGSDEPLKRVWLSKEWETVGSGANRCYLNRYFIEPLDR